MEQVIRAGLPRMMLQVVEEKAWAARKRRANGLIIEAGEECRRSQRTKMTLLGRYYELENECWCRCSGQKSKHPWRDDQQDFLRRDQTINHPQHHSPVGFSSTEDPCTFSRP